MTKHESYYQGARPEVVQFLPDRYAMVLEIGCGNGGFRQLLGPHTEYWGVEPETDVARQAANLLDKVLVGTFEDVRDQLPDACFDLVICNDVIEHLIDHDRFFKQIRGKMKPGAHLVGSIPNVRYYKNLFSLLVGKDWRYTNKGILDSTHLRYFTLRSLRRSLMENGFQPEKLRGINSAVYLKRKYCTNPLRTAANTIKYCFRFAAFSLFDLVTLGHSRDIKYAQIGFCFRRGE